MRFRLRLFAYVVLLLLPEGALASCDDITPRPPNLVLFLVDDFGWRDAGFQGSEFYATPHMDRFASEGLVFMRAYSNGPNCAPSRAAILSGQYAPRTGVYTVASPARGKARYRKLVPTPNETTLSDECVTLAETLQAAGYKTAAIGKWHLGDDPKRQGFDVNVGGNKTGSPRGGYFSPYKNPELPDGPEGEYLTDRLTEEALRFMEASKDGPFFLYLSHYAVHTPIQSKAELAEPFKQKAPHGGQKSAKYAGMITSVDQSLGRVLAKLTELELEEETLVVLYSDNGGVGGITDMTPLRGAKGMLYEGGIRVPLAVRWPGKIEAGRKTGEPVIGTDLYPTFVELAGTKPPEGIPLDGVSLTKLFDEETQLERAALYWHFPAYLEASKKSPTPFRTTPASAIRMDDLKLVEFFEDGHVELYDTSADLGEEHDLSAERPEETKRLLAALRAWREQVNAPVPTEPNPKYDPKATWPPEER